ncbi:MAG TPA: hypothetical protein VIE39_06845 [Thermoanaerobaculia bacterium]|jgi:hypothetical protein
MRRILLVAVAAVVLAAFAAPARAGDISVFGSWADTDSLGDSFGFGAKIDFSMFSALGMEFRGTYFPDLGESFEDIVDNDDDILEIDVEAIPIDGGLILQFGPGKNFFVSGGATYYLMDTDVGDVDDQWGWYLATGFKSGQPGGGIGFFGEVIYRDVDGSVNVDPEDFEDIDDIGFNGEVPVDLSGIGANVGVVFRF